VSEDQLREMQKLTPVVSVQNRYNLGDRSSEAMVDLCDAEDIVFLPWAPIQQTDDLVPVRIAAERLGASERQVALAWLLGRSAQILPIPGSGSAGHVADNVAAASLKLTSDESNAILNLAG
jgi:pyridoxine 4-dehydrogenase